MALSSAHAVLHLSIVESAEYLFVLGGGSGVQ
jgi:hypothetical protein